MTFSVLSFLKISNSVNTMLPVSAIGFTCTESSYYSPETKCDNVFDQDDSIEWITRGEAKGSWIKISFNAEIMITKILYSHNHQESFTNQYFKDVLFKFSDDLRLNVTLRYPQNEQSGRDIHFKIEPPVHSTFLEIEMLSGYDLSKNGEKDSPTDWKNLYGISYIQIYGLQRPRKLTH